MIEMDAWAVAAAILVKLGSSLHYGELTDRVVNTGLSGLSYKGGHTPGATLRAIMSEKTVDGKKVFCRPRRAHYAVNDPEAIQKVPQVRAALKELERFDRWGNSISGEETMETLRERIRELELRNSQLETIIHEMRKKSEQP